jgi:hypothetical protein
MLDHQEYDVPGGPIERVRVPMEIEAWRMVREGVAEPGVVDLISRLSLGINDGLLRRVLSAGPLKRGDVASELSIATHGDSRFRPLEDLFPPDGKESIWQTLDDIPDPFGEGASGELPARILVVGTPHLTHLWRDRLYASSEGRSQVDIWPLWDLSSIEEADLKRLMKNAPWDLIVEVLVGPTEDRRQLIDLLVPSIAKQGQVWAHMINLPSTVTVQVVPEEIVAIGVGGVPNRYGDPILEIARPRNSDVSDLVRAAGTATALGLKPYEVADEPGGVGVRLLATLINSTSFLVREGIIASEGVADKEVKRALEMPDSPFVIADEIGLDTVEGAILGLRAHLGEERYRVCPLLTMRIESGVVGRGTERGFYID